MSSGFNTRIERDKSEPYTVIFYTDDESKYREIEDACRKVIGHGKEQAVRLIDADAAREAVIERWKKRREEYGIYFETGCEYGKNDDLEWLDSLPTIDAIPLYFIKDRIEVFKAVPLPAFVDTLELLISQWEQVVNADAEK